MDTIIFDLGGVLIDWNPRHLYRKLFEHEEDMEHFLTYIATSDWNEEQDAGRPLHEATEWLLSRHPEHEHHIRAYYGRWEEMLGDPIKGTVEILRELREKPAYRLFALTNWSDETFPVALERYEFLHWFDDILVSGRERLRKPDPRFYALLRERFGIDFGSALFIDDLERNVRAARAEGLDTIHFQSPEQLRVELRLRGVDVSHLKM